MRRLASYEQTHLAERDVRQLSRLAMRRYPSIILFDNQEFPFAVEYLGLVSMYEVDEYQCYKTERADARGRSIFFLPGSATWSLSAFRPGPILLY
jgi:hypothetical protein